MSLNDKRHEMCCKLRELLCGPWITEWDVLYALGVKPGYELGFVDAESVATLAYLIDTTRCTIKSDTPGFHVGVRSNCGAMVETERAVFDATSALPIRFCPNCGARVNEGE